VGDGATVDRPTGTVTFLFTDLEGSTRLWDEHPEPMKDALARHDAIVRGAVETDKGHVVKMTGDGLHAAFSSAKDAVGAAIEAQEMLGAEEWAVPGGLHVRMGIHTGEAEYREADYYGSAVNRAARLAAIGSGGQILVSHATEELVSDGPDRFWLHDLGEHRLRDLSRAERVFQVCSPGLKSDFQPLRSLDALPGNLPVQLTSFVGREDEQRRLPEMLRTDRALTLTGVGGVGKTRLAIQIAADVLPRFRDGAWLCELAAADDADSAIELVAGTLGARPRPGLSLEESIVDYLRAKEALLVLDNCEHVLGAVGELADVVLRGCPHVRILSTSREGLAVEGERVMPLRSLPLPESAADEASAAVRLFVDRASAARPEFVLDEHNAEAVGEICRRLDGIPLAIELAAARVAAMSPADVAVRLGERFRLLTGGRRTAVERHQTLRATVEWSYSLLAPVERTVFGRLGVFVGGFDARAVEDVVTDDDVEPWDALDAVVSLVGKSMVIAEDAPDGTTRYQLLETLRAYARELLDQEGSADVWRRRHAEHYATKAEKVSPDLLGPREHEASQALLHELDNFRAAVTWGLDSDDVDNCGLAMRILSGLAVLGTFNRTTEISRWAVEALDRVEVAPPAWRADVLGMAAMQAMYLGQPEEIERLVAEAHRGGLPPDCKAPHLHYIALAASAAIRRQLDEAHRIVEDGHEVLDGITVAGDFHHGTLTQCEATWSLINGDLEDAQARIAEVMPMARRLGNPTFLAIALFAYGWSWWRDDPDRGLAALEESIELTERGATEAAYGPVLAQAARIHAIRGERRQALERLRQAVAHCHDVADRNEFTGALLAAGEILGRFGRHEAVAVIDGIRTDGGLVDFVIGFGGPEGEAQERAFADAATALGDGHAQAFARGAAMPYDDVVDFLFRTLDDLLDEASGGKTAVTTGRHHAAH